MSVAEWSVKAHVGKLTTSDVFLLGSNWGKYDAVGSDAASLCRKLLDVALSNSGKAQQPENAVWNALQNLMNEVNK